MYFTRRSNPSEISLRNLLMGDLSHEACEEYFNASETTCIIHSGERDIAFIYPTLVEVGIDAITAGIVENLFVDSLLALVFVGVAFAVWSEDGRTIRGIARPKVEEEKPPSWRNVIGHFWQMKPDTIRDLCGDSEDAVDHLLFQRGLIIIQAVVFAMALAIILPVNIL